MKEQLHFIWLCLAFMRKSAIQHPINRKEWYERI